MSKTKENLQKLHDYIRDNVAEEFIRMEYFRSDEYGFSKCYTSKEDCGTCGCALGWAPNAIPEILSDPKVFENSINGAPRIEFFKMSDRYFPDLNDDPSNYWDYLFSPDWVDDKQAILERIMNYINGTIPESWEPQ